MADYTETAELVKFEQKIDLRLNELRQENRCCDVRLEIDGKIFPCHRLVLIAASPYFEAMFNGNFKESICSSDTISLKDIEVEIFEEILNAIYTASFHLLPSNAYSFLKASHLLLLNAVENACVNYIRKNINAVHYLIEIYLFSKNVQQVMHAECGMIIAKNLFNYGRTDSFTQIPMDSFDEILTRWRPMSYEEEFTFQLISKWSKENRASCEEVQKLLLTSNLKISVFLSPILMAQYIISSDDTCVAFEMKNQSCAKMELDVHFDLNIYLEVIDVKTSQRGWGVLKINDKFDTYILSSFHPTNSLRRSVCKVGSKIYCLEYFDGENRRNHFSCYDENSNERISLSTPRELLEFYQLTSAGTSIYSTVLHRNYFSIWNYDCDSKSWNTCESFDIKNNPISAYTFSNGFSYLIVPDRSNHAVKLISTDSGFGSTRTLDKWRSKSEDPSFVLCGFNDKLVVCKCNVYHDKYSYIGVFDLTSEEWLVGFDDTKMNFKREKFCVIHHNGFIYAVENDRTVVNEKFSVEMKTWKNLPALPKRVTCRNANAVRELATGSVFGIDSEAKKN